MYIRFVQICISQGFVISSVQGQMHAGLENGEDGSWTSHDSLLS